MSAPLGSKLQDRLLAHYLSTHVRLADNDLRAGIASRRPYVHRLLRRHFPDRRDTSILDLGCGFGTILAILAEAGYTNAWGVDASPELVESARSLGLKNVRLGDMRQVAQGLRDEELDVILAFDVFEHLEKAEVLAICDNALRALRPGGRLIVHVPNAEGILAGSTVFGDLTHQTVFTRRSLEQMLRVAGFRRLVAEEDAPIVHGLKSAGRWATWQVIRSVARLAHVSQTGDSGKEMIFSQNLLVVAFKQGAAGPRSSP